MEAHLSRRFSRSSYPPLLDTTPLYHQYDPCTSFDSLPDDLPIEKHSVGMPSQISNCHIGDDDPYSEDLFSQGSAGGVASVDTSQASAVSGQLSQEYAMRTASLMFPSVSGRRKPVSSSTTRPTLLRREDATLGD